MSAFDGPAIVEVLQRHEVEYVLIGGFAAFVQGSPILTADVDITPQQEPGNLERLSAALVELEAKIRAAGTEPLPFAHDADSLARAGVWNLTTKHGDLDISFVPSGTGGYPDLVRDAVEVELRGTPVKLASLADILRSKDAAGRPKDLRALPVLRELVARQTRDRAARRDDP
jgi:predicted nucleotidyltransferase